MKKKAKAIWVPQAQEDLVEIKRFIARDAPRAAAALIRRIKAAVDRLRLFPESGWIVDEIGNPEVREIVEGNYRIIYRFRNKKVEILTVYHGARILSEEDLPLGEDDNGPTPTAPSDR